MPTIKELKEELAELGEKVGGNKAELETRLAKAKRAQKRKAKKKETKKALPKPKPKSKSRSKTPTKRPAKRKAVDDATSSSSKAKTKTKAKANANANAKAKPAPKKRAKKAPTTFKDQIMAFGRGGDDGDFWKTPLSLQAIKAGLVGQFGREDSAAFRKHVTKALKALVTSNVLLKLKGSYREPKTEGELEAEQKAAAVAASREGQYQCAWCGKWQPEDVYAMDEADDARGCSIKCEKCGRKSWKGIGQDEWFRHYRNGRSGEGGY